MTARRRHGVTLAVSVVPSRPNEVNFSRRNHEEHHSARQRLVEASLGWTRRKLGHSARAALGSAGGIDVFVATPRRRTPPEMCLVPPPGCCRPRCSRPGYSGCRRPLQFDGEPVSGDMLGRVLPGSPWSNTWTMNRPGDSQRLHLGPVAALEEGRLSPSDRLLADGSRHDQGSTTPCSRIGKNG